MAHRPYPTGSTVDAHEEVTEYKKAQKSTSALAHLQEVIQLPVNVCDMRQIDGGFAQEQSQLFA